VCDVRLTPAFKWWLIFLIPLTFTWKLVAEHPAFYEMQGNIAQFLVIHGFNVTEQTLVESVPIMRATKADCSMIVAEASPDGSTRDLMRHVAATLDQHFVVFRGKIYDEQPIWLTVTEDWWTRYLRKVGMSQQFEVPPIMVAATGSCAAEQLPWAELSGRLSDEMKK
jgi:hypothetical protein